MKVIPSKKLNSLPAYPFAFIKEKVQELKNKGIEVIDLGVGDPVFPTPEIIREACKKGVDIHSRSGYPSYIGSDKLRNTIKNWMKVKLDVQLDHEKNIISTIGSKEAIFHLPLVLLDDDDIALCPSPGYPPYSRGTLFAGGKPYYYPLIKDNDFLPSLNNIPDSIIKRTKILWICYPNAPTGKIPSISDLQQIADWADKRGIIIASDEAYIDFYYTNNPPPSMLQVKTEGVISFFSLSKRSAMTGYRVGWLAGDETIINYYKKLKTNIDSGIPHFAQEAAIAALNDESHVDEMRKNYREIGELFVNAFYEIGINSSLPEGAIYLWLEVPSEYSGESFTYKLLEPQIAIATVPGSWLADNIDGIGNPGEKYIRISFTVEKEKVKVACDRIKKFLR